LLLRIGSYQQRPPGFSSLESQMPAAHAAQAARGLPPCVAQYSRRVSQFSHLGIAGMTAADCTATGRPLRYRPRTAWSDFSAVNPGILILFIHVSLRLVNFDRWIRGVQTSPHFIGLDCKLRASKASGHYYCLSQSSLPATLLRRAPLDCR